MSRRGWLSFRSRPMGLGLLLLMLWFAFVVLAGYLVFSELYQNRLQAIENGQAELVDSSQAALNRELGHIRRLTRLLKEGLDTEQTLRAGSPVDRDQVSAHFRRFARAVEAVSQLRWLDPGGQEQVRVNVVDGESSVVPAADLQNKSDRYYFQQALQEPDGEVYISPLDLNVEHGRIVEPLEPTLRAAIRTGGKDGLLPGLLILNFNLAPLFAQLRQPATGGEHVELLDQSGYWLLAPDPAREWGQLLGRTDNNLAKIAPALWQRIAGGGHSGSSRHQGRLWHYTRLYYDDAIQEHAGAWLYVVSVSADGQIAALWRSLLLPVVFGCLLVMLAGGLFIGRLLQASREREALTRALAQEQMTLRQAYDQLQLSHDRLQQLQNELVESRKLSSLGMMVAGIAHELNTPTGGALMSVSTLQTQLQQLNGALASGLTRSALEDYLKQAEEGLNLADVNLQRAADLIRSFKRLAVDRNAGQVVRFKLLEPLQDLENILAPRLKRSRVTLSTRVPGALDMHSYPGTLSQVIQNLVENALCHAFADGSRGRIEVTADTGDCDQEVLIRVSDNGSGIAPDVIDTLFDPFVTTGRGTGHTGLGLHLVHQWVYQLLRGSIRVESALGAGTTFFLRIPRNTEA